MKQALLLDSPFSVPTVRRRTIAGVQHSVYHNDDRPVENDLLGFTREMLTDEITCEYPDAEIAFICRFYLQQYSGRNYDYFYNMHNAQNETPSKTLLKKITERVKQAYNKQATHTWDRRRKGIYPLEIILARHKLKISRYSIAIQRYLILNTMPHDLSMPLIYLTEPLKSQAIIRIWQDYEMKIGMPLQSIEFVYAGMRYSYRKLFNDSLHITWEQVA